MKTISQPAISIEFRNSTWYRTGKRGVDAQTGRETAEYERTRIDGQAIRLWADYTGRVTTENA